MALGYQNPFYLKQAQKKQQSLYDGKVLLEKHDPLVLHDLEETLQLAQESREKMNQLNKEIKPANYTKINHLSGVFVPQTAKSHEELYFSNISKMANVSKSISIPNDDFLDDATPSVARKFLNEVKSTIVTLQRVVKHRMTIEPHNWSSSAHQELHKIVKDEIFPIVNQVDTIMQNFEIQFLKEATKFVGDFKSLTNEADASLAMRKALELENERLLKAVVNRDIMNIVQKESVVDTSNLQTELERMFRINPFKTSREETHVPNNVSASARTKPITISQPSVIPKKDVNSDSNGFSSTGVDNTKTRRPQPCSNTKNDRVPSTSKSSQSKNKEAEVEEHHRNLLLSKNNKHISSACYLDLFVFMGTVRFRNDHIAAILGFGQFCDSDLEVAFRRNACFDKNLDGVNLLKGDRSTNLYTINLHEMASAAPICLMARASSTKSWLWHQRKVDILFLHVFGALCYPKNDREDIGKLGVKAMYDDYIGGQASATARTILPAQEPQVCQTSTASTTIADTTPTLTNSSSHATNILILSQDVDELNSNAMVDGNTFVNPFANPSTTAAESPSLQNVDPSNIRCVGSI
nr:hypothetical protein [Tanacetum cinerariifolium]